jgi:hypothetical protein
MPQDMIFFLHCCQQLPLAVAREAKGYIIKWAEFQLLGHCNPSCVSFLKGQTLAKAP